MAFASFCDNMASPSKKLRMENGSAAPSGQSGPPVYIMHGRVYHKVGTLYPSGDDSQPKYSQLYIYDPAEATTQRSNSFTDLGTGILRSLHDMLLENVPDVDMWSGAITEPPLRVPRNPYPVHFVNMHDKVLQTEADADSRRTDPSIHALRFAGGKDLDPRTYIAPSSAEVSCMVVW